MLWLDDYCGINCKLILFELDIIFDYLRNYCISYGLYKKKLKDEVVRLRI